MKDYLFIAVVLIVGHSVPTWGQNYQVYYPGSESSSSQAPNFNQGSLPVVHNPFGGPQARDQFPRSGEVLGNFFNGQVPASPSQQPQHLNSFNTNLFSNANSRFQPEVQNSFPITSNYLSPPVSTSLPRQTHFFGNNYDFFRQFHNSHLPQNNPPLQSSQQQFRPSTPINTFHQNQGNNKESTKVPQTTPTTFTTSQFFNVDPNSNSNNNDAYTFTIGGQSSPSPASFSPSQVPPVSFPPSQSPPISFSPSQSTPLPRAPSSQASYQVEQTYQTPTHRTPTSYPANIINNNNNNILQHNSLNTYEEAAKALGLSHNLRVITTESLQAYPTASLLTPEVTTESPVTSTQLPLTPTTTTTTEASTTTTSTTTTASTTVPTTPVAISFRSTSRSTGRAVNAVNVTPAAKAIVRQRQPLFRQANRVVNVNNDIEEPPTTYRPRPEPQQEQQQKQKQIPQQKPQQARVLSQGRPLSPQSQEQAQGRVVLSQGRPLGPTQNSDPHGPYYYNNLQPGLLYTNTNGAYQSYYNGQQQEQNQQQQVGLEELVPEVIDFNIPRKMIPLYEQEETQEEFPQQFPLQQVTQRQPVIIVTEATPVTSTKKLESSEVYRVGPKGRLLKKRRRVRPQGAQRAVQQQSTALSYAVRNNNNNNNRVDATTFRPIAANVDENEEVTTYRSKFRYSPSTSTMSTTESSTKNGGDSSTGPGSEQQNQLIASRLKSLERQIRFKGRKNN